MLERIRILVMRVIMCPRHTAAYHLLPFIKRWLQIYAIKMVNSVTHFLSLSFLSSIFTKGNVVWTKHFLFFRIPLQSFVFLRLGYCLWSKDYCCVRAKERIRSTRHNNCGQGIISIFIFIKSTSVKLKGNSTRRHTYDSSGWLGESW